MLALVEQNSWMIPAGLRLLLRRCSGSVEMGGSRGVLSVPGTQQLAEQHWVKQI